AVALPYLLSGDVRPYTQLTTSEVRAAAIAGRAAGGEPILAPVILGTAIPALTGEPSWVGHPIWTPDLENRTFQTGLLLSGLLTPAQDRAMIRTTASRALVQPCGWPGRLEPALAPLGFREVRVGCARVYIRPVSGPAV
ncbi:MAG TPA: hypothetical protein VKU35_01155, partial [Candidatus Limnocylindria bacterium]|nr:hypothetical protein [Candidatus Limnocylindria bacterium]